MKRLLSLVLLSFPLLATAQVSYNTITATVTDQNGSPFAGAQLRATLVYPNGIPVNGVTTPNGQPFNGSPSYGTLDSTGHFSIQLVPNGILRLPGARSLGGSQWLIAISAPQDPNIIVNQAAWNLSYQFTVTGDQDISSQLSALATQTISYVNLKSNQTSLRASGGTPASPSFSIQYNGGSGSFAGDTGFTYNPTSHLEQVQSLLSSINGVVNVKASPYNAVGDGVADDTASFQSACAAIRNTSSNVGSHMVIPPGTYKITDSINCTGGSSFVRGLHIEGSGMENTLINCNLPAGKAYPCLDFTGASQDALIEKFELDGVSGGNQTAGILFARSSTVNGGTGSDDGTIRAIRIDGSFAKAALAGISADTPHVEDSSIQCAGPCTTVIYWGALDDLGIPSEYETFNTASIAFTQAFFERNALYYYNTFGGTAGTGNGAGAAFRFDGATGKIQILNTFIAKNNTSGNVADIRAGGGNTFQSSLTLANVRSENNNGASNFFLDMENGEAIEGGTWDVSIASTNTALVPFYMAHSALIQYVTPANIFIDQNFTWTAGDGTGQFQNNDFNFEQGFGTWGTAFDTTHSYANSITTNNSLGPLPKFSAGGSLLSGIVRQAAGSSLYSFTNNFIGSGSPWNLCNANSSTTSCTAAFSVDNTGISTQASDANIGGNANITSLMHSQDAVVSTPGASATLGLESLSNPSLASGTNWSASTSPGALDCVTVGNPTTCSYTTGNTEGRIIQNAASMAIAPKLSTAYYFCYTVTASTMVPANGDNAFILNDVTQFVHQATNVYLPVTVGTHCVDITSSATTINSFTLGFTINTAGASVTFGTLTLKQNLNGVSIASGNISAGGQLAGTTLQIGSGTPISSQSSANSQVVTCPAGGTGTQVCAANGSWVSGTGSGSVNSGSGYAIPAYGSAAGTVVGPSNVKTDSTGNNLNVPGTFSVGATTPTACGSAVGCEAFIEGSTAGTPTTGQDYRRADSATHSFLCSFNGGAETSCSSASGGGLGNVQITTGTASVSPLSCTAETTVAITGLLTTSSLSQPTATGSDPTTVSGWAPGGTLYISTRIVSAGTMGWRECNSSSTASVAAGASVTWNIGAQ